MHYGCGIHVVDFTSKTWTQQKDRLLSSLTSWTSCTISINRPSNSNSAPIGTLKQLILSFDWSKSFAKALNYKVSKRLGSVPQQQEVRFECYVFNFRLFHELSH